MSNNPQTMKLKVTLDRTHETLSKIKSLKEQVTRAFTEGLYDREYYLYILNDMQRLEAETRRYILFIESKLQHAGHVFQQPKQGKPRFEIYI